MEVLGVKIDLIQVIMLIIASVSWIVTYLQQSTRISKDARDFLKKYQQLVEDTVIEASGLYQESPAKRKLYVVNEIKRYLKNVLLVKNIPGNAILNEVIEHIYNKLKSRIENLDSVTFENSGVKNDGKAT